VISKRYERVWFQSDFYRDCYHKTLRWVIFSVAVILFLILLNIYFILFPGTRQYYVSTTKGQLYQWCLPQNRFVDVGTC